jgi:predicted TIM-barrel fold metal-dependent hydrolase
MTRPVEVVDFHTHAGSPGRTQVCGTPEAMVLNMDLSDIGRACVNCIWFGDARRGNDLMHRFVAEYPDRIIPVAFVTPHYPEESISELERCFGTLGMKYLKIYPDFFFKPQDDEAYFPIYEWVNERGLPVMSHATYPFDSPEVSIPERYEALSKRFSNIKWVIAHAAGSTNPGACEAARSLPAVYLETCDSGTPHGAIEYSVKHAGADRVLFGTDSPIMDGRHHIAKVVTADISEEDKIKILGLNAIELLGLDES